jgi:circadian clock protein KaiC
VAAGAGGRRTGELLRGDVTDDVLQGRAPLDILSLDTLLRGGLTRGTSTLVVGSLGTGRTLLALHFALAGARAGAPTLFLGLRESHRQLVLETEPFVLGAEMHTALGPRGVVTLPCWAPVELNPDIVADQLLATLDRLQIRRLVVDSAAELERAVLEGGDLHRVDNYLAALIEALRLRGITALFTREFPQTAAPALDFAANPISAMAENVLLLRQIEGRGKLTCLLAVIKIPFSTPDVSTMRELTITAPEGVRVRGLTNDLGAATGSGKAPPQRGAGGNQAEETGSGRTQRETRVTAGDQSSSTEGLL